jgi:hypothetical protein
MTSVKIGMRKSLCKVTFDMYQGALAEESFQYYLSKISFQCSHRPNTSEAALWNKKTLHVAEYPYVLLVASEHNRVVQEVRANKKKYIHSLRFILWTLME